ncbi:hypothetical protein C6344_13980 [Bacillus sp. GBSW19]|uniref:hypothetical protein n=1 Tax=Bacillus sp. GBSW19 TaxID=2108545 RepID=UPI000D038E8F|nr:hypothetical protein [Bacillus sp. GBSW19]PRS59521.1 hypothetical protein C6344_13980 [Bacillus sp. GBSW19]
MKLAEIHSKNKDEEMVSLWRTALLSSIEMKQPAIERVSTTGCFIKCHDPCLKNESQSRMWGLFNMLEIIVF